MPIQSRIRSSIAAFAIAALAAASAFTPAAASPDLRDAVRVIESPLTKPSVDVTYVSQHDDLIPRRIYKFRVKNTSLRDATGVGMHGLCHYKSGSGEEYNVRAWAVEPDSWLNGLKAGASHDFYVFCPNVFQGDALDGGVGDASIHFHPSGDSATDSAQSW